MTPGPELLDAYADLLVGFGANVQPGQIVSLEADVGKETLTRRVAASAYRHGARFVDVQYFDPWIKRTRIELAGEETLEYVPPWYGARVLALGEHRAARIRLDGAVAPRILDDLDATRAGRDQLPRLAESIKVVGDRTTNWTIGPAPTAGWAAVVYPDLEPADALARLWEDIVHVLRLDESDPVEAWRERHEVLLASAAKLTERRFDALRFRGEGTDLTVGLLPSSSWLTARFETVDGIVHAPNLPSEETFTTPDPVRVDGHVRATKPLVLSGSTVEGLTVRFEGGRAVEVGASHGVDAVRSLIGKDDGACRLGEVALVDRHGRIGPLDRVFYDTLLDENAASHIAFGSAYGFACEDPADRERANHSQVHADFMIGTDLLEVDGLDAQGAAVPLLRGGDWQL